MNIRLTRIAPGYYEYKTERREYQISRNPFDRKRWDVDCLIDGLCEWFECTWAGLDDAREMIKADLLETNPGDR